MNHSRSKTHLPLTGGWQWLLLLACLFSENAKSQPAGAAGADRLDKDIPALMKNADIPGLSAALVRDGRLVWVKPFGVANAATKIPVTENSVFQAASLSKPVFAYGVLKLVDAGRLSLDTPLTRYLGTDYGVADPRIHRITARHVLSHTAGFPNWRGNDHTDSLLIHSDPGAKFSYSGEGMVYLSRVVEKITGMPIEDYLQQNVLQPLGMTASSYLWQDRFDSLKVFDHDAVGNVSGRYQPAGGHAESMKQGANVAASLSTNAADYAKFIVAVLNGTGLNAETRAQMTAPQVRIDAKYPALAWGLGIGLETMREGEYLWHWGDNGDAKAYVAAFLPGKNAFVYFANSANGLSITKELLADGLGGEHPALDHLAYDHFNSPVKNFLRSVVARGAGPALRDYRRQRTADSSGRISEESMNNVGYLLLRLKRPADAVALFRQNTADFPQSWNAWDSLGEGYLANEQKTEGIAAYRRSLALNPGNANAAAILKKAQP